MVWETETEYKTIRLHRGPVHGIVEFETEIIHRTPPSDEGWCTFQGIPAWWDGEKGLIVMNLLGSFSSLAEVIKERGNYRTTKKYKIPNNSLLNEIHCKVDWGSCAKCWTISKPYPINPRLVVKIAIHHNWISHYITQHEGKVLGCNSNESDPVELRPDPNDFNNLVERLLSR